MLIPFKSFLYEVLHDVACSLLLDLLHLVFNLAGSAFTCLAVFTLPLCGSV
jgi:hypothetical protein